jgi:hypothetical protein
MKVCVLDNDVLDPVVAPTYVSYGAMLARLMRDAGAEWSIDIFNTTQGHYPDSFADYDAVMLTGSKARYSGGQAKAGGCLFWPPAGGLVPGGQSGARTSRLGLGAHDLPVA